MIPMYGELNVVQVAEEAAKGEAMRDRQNYLPFMQAIYKFASENEVVVGGKTATRLLLRAAGDPPTLESYSTVELFSAKASQHARQLADQLYAVAPGGLGHYTRADTHGLECSVIVNGRELAKVKSLPAHRGETLSEMVIPTKRPAIFVSAQLSCMGPEIQLIDTYRSLCDPAKAGEWPSLLQDETALRRLFVAGMREKIKEATGGKPQTFAPKGNTDLWKALSDKFIRGSGRVVVGRASTDIGSIATGRCRRLQLVSANRLDEEAEDLRRLAASVSVPISVKTDNDPKVPIDPRLRRLTGYITSGSGTRDAFIDIFSAGQYELIPWVERGGARVGTPLVIMRFGLVDLWTMQLLTHIQSVTKGYARGVLFDTLRDYEQTAVALDKILAGPATQALQSLFPFLQGAAGNGRGFVGHWEDQIVAQKRRDWSSEKGRSFQPPYFPLVRAKREAAAPAAVQDK